MAGMPINPDDYYVTTSRRGEHPERWSWEICRKSQPLGIKMTVRWFPVRLGRSVCRTEGVGGFSVRPSKGRQTPTQVSWRHLSWWARRVEAFGRSGSRKRSKLRPSDIHQVV